MLLFSLYANEDTIPESDLQMDEDGVLEVDDFCRALVQTTKNNIEEIDDRISQHLQGWTLDRIPKTSLAILRLSAAQLLYMKDIPVAVVISEAVQLAKRFGDGGDHVFINGALSGFEKSLPEDSRNENG